MTGCPARSGAVHRARVSTWGSCPLLCSPESSGRRTPIQGLMTPWELHSGGLGPPETPSWQAPLEVDALILQVKWKCTGSGAVRADQRLSTRAWAPPRPGNESPRATAKDPTPGGGAWGPRVPQPGPPDSDLLSNDSNQGRVAPGRETDRQAEQRNQTEARAGHTRHGQRTHRRSSGETGRSFGIHRHAKERIDLDPNLTPHIRNSKQTTGQEGQEEPFGVMAGWHH